MKTATLRKMAMDVTERDTRDVLDTHGCFSEELFWNISQNSQKRKQGESIFIKRTSCSIATFCFLHFAHSSLLLASCSLVFAC